jgi:hypothetical protein
MRVTSLLLFVPLALCAPMPAPFVPTIDYKSLQHFKDTPIDGPVLARDVAAQLAAREPGEILCLEMPTASLQGRTIEADVLLARTTSTVTVCGERVELQRRLADRSLLDAVGSN